MIEDFIHRIRCLLRGHDWHERVGSPLEIRLCRRCPRVETRHQVWR